MLLFNAYVAFALLSSTMLWAAKRRDARR